MRLRKPCEHGRYDAHLLLSGREVAAWGIQMYLLNGGGSDDISVCPGGEFLPEDALVIEKEDGEWPKAVILTLASGWLRRLNSNVSVEIRLRDALDRLSQGVHVLAADQVGEPG